MTTIDSAKATEIGGIKQRGGYSKKLLDRKMRDAAKLGLRRLFEAGQYLGFDILPRHFYSEIPSMRELRKTSHWRQPLSMVGVGGSDPDEQLTFVRGCCPDELIAQQPGLDIHEQACAENGAHGFGPIEADFLYCFVRTKRPKRIFQIGCGVSTSVCIRAAMDAGYEPSVTCLEPYPTDFLVRCQADGRIALIKEKAQAVPLVDMCLDSLENGDLFFVDSTHTLGPGGEVTRIMLEMLPRLSAGVHVHFHDIFFPYDYSRYILSEDLFFLHETPLLHALLVNNERLKLSAALSMLHYAKKNELKKYLPNYSPAQEEFGVQTAPGHFPSSAYLRVVQ